MTKIPESAADLSAEWLAEVLGLAVDSVEIEPVGVGIGLLGELFRITPSYGGGIGPKSLVAKIQAPSEESRFVAHVLSMYKREVNFYEALQSDTKMAVPNIVHSAFDPETQAFVLLMEDLSGGRNPNQQDGMNLVDVELAIDRLVELHASWWNDPKLMELDWLTRLCDSPYPEAVVMSYQAGWPVCQELFAEHMTPEAKALGDRFDGLLPGLMQRLSEPPFTLSHGDYRAENFFFFDDQDPAMLVLDWQLVDRSRGGRDLSYFLGGSLTTENRVAHEEALVRRYVDGLAGAGVTDYDFDTAWTDYRLGTLFAFVRVDSSKTSAWGVSLPHIVFSALTGVGWWCRLRLVDGAFYESAQGCDFEIGR